MKNRKNDENEMKYALELFENNWRDSFLIGLTDCLLRNWENKMQKPLKLLDQFISLKLNNYQGNRNTLISLKKNLFLETMFCH